MSLTSAHPVLVAHRYVERDLDRHRLLALGQHVVLVTDGRKNSVHNAFIVERALERALLENRVALDRDNHLGPSSRRCQLDSQHALTVANDLGVGVVVVDFIFRRQVYRCRGNQVRRKQLSIPAGQRRVRFLRDCGQAAEQYRREGRESEAGSWAHA